MTDGDDRRFLARAIALAGAARRRAHPNPTVGCVLSRDGVVVGEGVSGRVGEPHAEVHALRMAGEDARGATLHVTLEPCAHHGRTPPCTDAILRAGVRRVVLGAADPDPVAAGGARVLSDAGLEVTTDPLGPWCVALHETFLGRVRASRPWVVLKVAQTVDGSLVHPERRWVTGPAARRVVHRLRAQADAVLVGSGTVVADDPRLDVRHVTTSARPRPVVLDARGRTPAEARVARPGGLVVTTERSHHGWRQELVDRGVTVEVVPDAGTRGVDLSAAMAVLVAHGVHHVLAEPGATLAAAMVRAGVVDRLVRHVALDAATPSDVRAVPGLESTTVWRHRAWRRLGEDLEVVQGAG